MRPASQIVARVFPGGPAARPQGQSQWAPPSHFVTQNVKRVEICSQSVLSIVLSRASLGGFSFLASVWW